MRDSYVYSVKEEERFLVLFVSGIYFWYCGCNVDSGGYYRDGEVVGNIRVLEIFCFVVKDEVDVCILLVFRLLVLGEIV